MRLFFFSLLSIVYLMCLVHRSVSVLPEYCFHPPNTTDCGEPPKPIYYYYKPGSRCELNTWRGCPTYNIFETEALCSHVCLFPFLRLGETSEPEDTSRNKSDDNKCTKQTIKVYTYDIANKICSPVMWTGCNTSNLFRSEHDCLTKSKACHRVKTTPDFDDKVKLLSPHEANKIASILDAISHSKFEHEVSGVPTKAPEKPEDKPTGNGGVTKKTSSKTSSMETVSTKMVNGIGSTRPAVVPITVPAAVPTRVPAAVSTTVLAEVSSKALTTTTEESYYDYGDPSEVLMP